MSKISFQEILRKSVLKDFSKIKITGLKIVLFLKNVSEFFFPFFLKDFDKG